MKQKSLLKTMLLLFALIAGSSSVWAVGEKIVIDDWYALLGVTASAGSLTGDDNKDYSGTIAGITVEYKKASYQYVKSNDLRIYNGSNITFTAPTGYLITEIAFTGTTSSEKAPTANTGTFDYSTKKWTGSANSITLSRNSGSGYTKFVTATFTLSAPATFGAGKTMISFSSTISAFDFTDANRPEGLKAYKVSAADGTSVTLTEVTSNVAKNTGLILTGTAETTYRIPVLGSGTDISATNLLVATDGTSTVSDAAVLKDGKFHPLNSGVIAAGKAYLPYANITGGDPFTGGAPALDIVFGGTTGIESVKGAEFMTNGEFYNLAGQRVAQPTKGLYIVNGKKVIIK